MLSKSIHLTTNEGIISVLFFRNIATQVAFQVSQGTVSRIIDEVSRAIASFFDEEVVFPTGEEAEIVANEFFKVG